MKITVNEYYRNCILVYILLLTKAGFVFCELYSAYSSIFFFILLFYICLRRSIIINRTQLSITTIILGCMILTGLFKGFPETNQFILTFINLLTSLLLVSIISFNRFSKCFSDIIFLICICSLIGQLTIILGIPIVNNLPLLTNSKGISAHFGIFAEFGAEAHNGVYRLQGIFWEPGAFQTMIIIALLLDIYINRPPKVKLRIVLMIITICLTYSTTGLVCLMLFLLLLSLKGHKLSFKNFIVILGVVG